MKCTILYQTMTPSAYHFSVPVLQTNQRVRVVRCTIFYKKNVNKNMYWQLCIKPIRCLQFVECSGETNKRTQFLLLSMCLMLTEYTGVDTRVLTHAE